jgi:hypothetical protein
MADGDTKQIIAKRPKRFRLSKQSVIVIALLLVAITGLGTWYYLAHKKPFVYQPDASKTQLKHLSDLMFQGKSCQDVVTYIDKELPGISNRSVRYDLLAEKADCQTQDNKDAALQTYRQAYKLGGVNRPAVGFVLAQDYKDKNNLKAAKAIYLQLQTYFRNDTKDSATIKAYQLKFINQQLSKMGVKQ